MPQMNGAKAIAKVLKKEKVTHVFSLPSGEILPIFDELVSEGINVITMRHEQAVGNAADGWARITRSPGVCIVPIGPGLVNLMPAIVQAYYMGSPMVAIAPCISQKLVNMDATYDVDAQALLGSVTKWNKRCLSPNRIGEYVQQAFQEACSGRMAPTLLEIPKDIITTPYEAKTTASPSSHKLGRIHGDPYLIKQAVELLSTAQRPVIMAGSGVYWSGACTELVKVAKLFSAPVACEGLAVGCIPQEHPLSIFNAIANPLIKQADVILVVGAKLDEFLGFGRDPSFYADDAKFIHIDIDSSVVGKNRTTQVGIVGDARAVLNQIIKAAGTIARNKAAASFAKQTRANWMQMLDIFDKDGLSSEVPIKPQRLMKEIREFASSDSLFVLDGGDTSAWGYVYLRANYPGQIIGSTGPLQHLGAGLPISIAAKLAKPETPVFLITGDGSLLFNVSELDTAVRHEVPVIVIVNNDSAWGLVYHTRLLKTQSEEKAKQGTLLSEDVRYDKLAASLGASGELVTKPDEIKPALKRAVESGQPYVIDVRVSRKYMTVLSQIFSAKRDI
jgi:acetolactate synthase-1/2/3 large subunit